MSYNKRFLYVAVGAPGSAHDARMLKESTCFDEVISGRAMPDRKVELGNYSEIPLVTIGDPAFPRFAWIIKCCDGSTKGKHQRHFNKMLCSARVVFKYA